ncbi:MAG: class I SAM-dependent methyltransferase [Pseudomonadota bacterium]
MADLDDRDKNGGNAGTQSGNGDSDEFSVEVEEVTAEDAMKADPAEAGQPQPADASGSQGAKDEDVEELPIDVEESDDAGEKSAPAAQKLRPLRYEEEISRPSIMVAEDHETEELSGELKEDPVVMSFVQVVGKRRSGFSDHEPLTPPPIEPDTRPPPPPRGGHAPPTPPPFSMDKTPPMGQPSVAERDAPYAPPPPAMDGVPSAQPPAWDLTAAVEEERPSSPETRANETQSERAPAARASSVPPPPPPFPQSFSRPPPPPSRIADTRPPPPALTEEAGMQYSIITGGSKPPPPPAIRPDTKPPPPPPPWLSAVSTLPPPPPPPVDAAETAEEAMEPGTGIDEEETTDRIRYSEEPELLEEADIQVRESEPRKAAQEEEKEGEGRIDRISEIEEIQEIEEIDEPPAEAEAEAEKAAAAPGEADKSQETEEAAEEVEEVEEVEAVEAAEEAIEEIDIIPQSVSIPPPPPPAHRPSKDPPPPPNGAEPKKPPPPPDAVKGLSMKSIEGHLPSIIAIPDDEVPRDEEHRDAAARKGVSAPDAVPFAAPIPKPKKKWFEEIFDENYIRVLPELTELQRRREINFIEKNLGVKPGAMLLDLGCGTGVHCIGLAKKDYQMVGLDLSVAMLAIASEAAQESDCKINFIQKDMRELDFTGVFDAIYCVGSSFGYFEDEENDKVIMGIHRALKPGGMFLLDVDNRDFVIQQQPGLLWFEGQGVVCMEETSFNFITSRLRAKRSLLFENGVKKIHLYSMRLYSLHELGRMLHNAGFRVDSVGGHRAAPRAFCGEDSVKIIIVAQKRFGNDKK